MASETLAKIDRAYDVVSALCEGKREWLMSTPARPDHDPDLIIGDALLAARNEIARLTLELEEARERERGVRSAVIRAVAALVRLAPRLDPREEAEWVPRGSVVEIATRLKDEVLALSTLQEVNDV